jgi:hypothetical protein
MGNVVVNLELMNLNLYLPQSQPEVDQAVEPVPRQGGDYFGCGGRRCELHSRLRWSKDNGQESSIEIKILKLKIADTPAPVIQLLHVRDGARNPFL